MKRSLGILAVFCVFCVILYSCSPAPEASGTAATGGSTQQQETSAAAPGSQTTLDMGTDQMGATGYVIGEAIASTVNKYSDSVKIATMTTSGGAEDMHLLSVSEIDLGNGTSRDWYASLSGASPFTEPADIDQLFAVAWYNMPLFVAKDSKIQSYNDLNGKRVFAGGSGSGSFAIYTDLFKTLGLYDKVTWVDCSWTDAYEAIRNGTIDACALLTLNNKPSSTVAQMEEIFDYKMLQLDDPEGVVAKMQEINGGYILNTITPENFKKLNEDVPFVCTSSIFGCLPDLSEDVVYEIVKQTFEHLDELKTMAPDLEALTPEIAVSLMVKDVGVHPGAVKYFKEIGVWDDTLTVGE